MKPKEINANRQTRTIQVIWQDEHISVYPFSLLRYGCPCASCRGGHEKMKSTPDPIVFSLPDQDSPATRLENIEPIGAYALCLIWEDGHNYGIYTWDYLRSLCPCPGCRFADV